MKIKLLFAWYDFWIGLFWDKKKKWLYILPVPCFGIILKLNSFFLPDGYYIREDYSNDKGYYNMWHNGQQVGGFKTKWGAIKYAHHNEKQLSLNAKS